MDKKEVASLRYREVVHCAHPVFKGTCVHWHVSGELVEYKKQPQAWRLPLRYGYYVYSEINRHNVDNFHRERDCPNSKSFFKPAEARLASVVLEAVRAKQQTLPFSSEDKKRKGINLG